MDRFNDQHCRQIWTSHKGNKESRALARITTHQGTVSGSGNVVAGRDKTRKYLPSMDKGRTIETRQHTRAQWRTSSRNLRRGEDKPRLFYHKSRYTQRQWISPQLRSGVQPAGIHFIRGLCAWRLNLAITAAEVHMKITETQST